MRATQIKKTAFLILFGVFMVFSCKQQEEGLDVDIQFVGKWRIRKPNTGKAPNVCYVDEIIIGKSSYTIRFQSGKNGIIRDHVYEGTHEFNGNTLSFPGVAALNSIERIDDNLFFEFEYDEELGFFCSYIGWQVEHRHDNFNAIGKKD